MCFASKTVWFKYKNKRKDKKVKIFKWYTNIPLIYRNLGAFVLGCVAGIILYKLGMIRGANSQSPPKPMSIES